MLTFSVLPADGDGTRFVWDFGDGSGGEGPSVTHRYDRRGDFDVRLSLADTPGTTRAEMVVQVRSLTGEWSTRDDGGPAGFGFRFELDQQGAVLDGRVTLFSLCPIVSGPSRYPPGTIDGWVADPRSVGWTLNCGGRVSRWTGEADATLDELHMKRVAGSADVERVYYREPPTGGDSAAAAPWSAPAHPVSQYCVSANAG